MNIIEDYDPFVFDEHVEELYPSRSFVSIKKGKSIAKIGGLVQSKSE